MSARNFIGNLLAPKSATVIVFIAVLSSGCSMFGKKLEPIAEPVRIKRDEFVLRKPLNLKCDSAKEFITTMQYLKKESELSLNPEEATKVSLDVSSGCNGAAKRFIQNTDMLRQSGMDARSAVKLGRRLATTDEAASAAFTKVFRLAFERFHLDLDFATAVRLAETLSVDFVGDPALAASDFDSIVSFCTRRKGLDMSKPNCGELAMRVSRMSAEMDNKYSSAMKNGLAEMFIDSFDYLTSKDGPGLTSGDALKIAENIAASGPVALDNFKEVYSYVTSSKGLSLSRGDGVKLAATVAANSRNRPLEPRRL